MFGQQNLIQEVQKVCSCWNCSNTKGSSGVFFPRRHKYNLCCDKNWAVDFASGRSECFVQTKLIRKCSLPYIRLAEHSQPDRIHIIDKVFLNPCLCVPPTVSWGPRLAKTGIQSKTALGASHQHKIDLERKKSLGYESSLVLAKSARFGIEHCINCYARQRLNSVLPIDVFIVSSNGDCYPSSQYMSKSGQIIKQGGNLLVNRVVEAQDGRYVDHSVQQ